MQLAMLARCSSLPCSIALTGSLSPRRLADTVAAGILPSEQECEPHFFFLGVKKHLRTKLWLAVHEQPTRKGVQAGVFSAAEDAARAVDTTLHAAGRPPANFVDGSPMLTSTVESRARAYLQVCCCCCCLVTLYALQRLTEACAGAEAGDAVTAALTSFPKWWQDEVPVQEACATSELSGGNCVQDLVSAICCLLPTQPTKFTPCSLQAAAQASKFATQHSQQCHCSFAPTESQAAGYCSGQQRR